VKFIPNPYAKGTHEVGLHVTQLLLREKVGTVLAKNVGMEPYSHLSMRGVLIYMGTAATVEEAVYKYKIGVLTRMTGPTGFFKIFGF
jgi:predicted Fe-Mo cluster-binding NifX family protein